MVRPSPSPCVPPRLVGVWSRKLFTTVEGHSDTTSLALWLQTDTLFADLRIPASCLRPDGHTGLWAPSDADLDAQISFAGHACLGSDNTTCAWSQYVNRGTPFLPGGQPVLEAPEQPDCAQLKWLSDDLLHEDEADGFYHETWTRLPESVGSSWAFNLSDHNQPGRLAVLVSAGDCFIFCAAAPPGGGLNKAAYEASYGRVSGGTHPWEIQHSTQPHRIGAALFPPTVGGTADDIEAAAAACGGRLQLGSQGTSWVAVRSFPAAPLDVIDLGVLGSAQNADEVAKLKALLASKVNAFTVRTDAFVEPSLVERTYAHAKAFHALPTAVKQQLHFSLHADGRGWIPLHGEGAYEDGPVASHVSTFDMGRDLASDHPAVVAGLSGCAPNVYPGEEHIPGFKQDMLRLDAGLAAGAGAMFTGLASALGVDPKAFDTLFVEGTSLGKLRLMSYPGSKASPALAAAKNLGVSAHSDFEAFTFLHQDAPGLQLQTYSSHWGARGVGQWYEAPVPDASHFTLICSDMLEILANGTIKATQHRVAFVPWPRTALIRFVGFESSAVVAPLPGTAGPPAYAPVTQAAHLDAKVDAAEARRKRSAEAGVIPVPVGPPAAGPA